MFIMVNHLTRHTPVNANIFSRDEACLIGAKKEDHVSNIQWICLHGQLVVVWRQALRKLCCLVSIHPGEMELTRALPDKLMARAWVRAAIPPFAAV